MMEKKLLQAQEELKQAMMFNQELAAKLGDPGFKAHPCSQTRFFEQQRQHAPLEHGRTVPLLQARFQQGRGGQNPPQLGRTNIE